MKGIVLAGGLGTRLMPLTKVVNKQLMPIYNRPLIHYPVMTLRDAGIKEILIISGPVHTGQLLDALGSGKEFGVRLSYDIQEEPKGLAHGLAIAEDFADSGKIVFILGDNVFGNNAEIEKAAADFEEQEKGAKVGLVRMPDPERFGVPRFDRRGKKIIEIVEKPKKPWTNWIVPGIYFYDNRVFDLIRKLKPSARGEYEITDLNNFYIKEKTLTFQKIRGKWFDIGTFDALLEASTFMAKRAKKQ